MKKTMIVPGNWFMQGKIMSINRKWVQIEPIFENILPEDLKPIPLTPEILEKVCGFEYDTHNEVYTFWRFAIDKSGRFYTSNSAVSCGDYVRKVLYLHDLQNIIEALAENSLPIDEDALRTS